MAKNDLRVDGMDFDKGLDMDFSLESKSMANMSKREVVTETAKGVYEGAVNKLTDPNAWLQGVRDQLPRGYKATWDAYDQTSKTVGELYDHAQKELKPALSQISTKLDDLVPEHSKFLKKITQSLRNTFEDTSRMGRSESAKDIEDKGVADMFSQILGSQQTASETAEKLATAREVASQKLSKDRHEEGMKYFSRIDENLNKLSAYQLNQGSFIQRKSLELQFRQYSVLGQIHLEQKRQGEMLLRQLADIKVNTGLPETKKITMSDRFKEDMKSRVYGGAMDALHSDENAIGRMLNRIKKDFKDIVSQFSSGLQMGILGMDSIGMALDTSVGGSLPNTIGNVVGGEAGNWVRKKVLGKVMPAFVKDPKFQHYSELFKLYVTNPNYGLEALKKTKIWDEIKKKGYEDEANDLLDYLKNTIKSPEKNQKLEKQNTFLGALDPIAETRRSMTVRTDVVPGYLARILQEVTRARLKKEDVPLLRYDPLTGQFKNERDLQRSITSHLKTRAALDGGGGKAKAESETILDQLGEDKVDSRPMAELLYELTDRTSPVTKETILRSEAYKRASEKGKAVLRKAAERLGIDTTENLKFTADFEDSIDSVRRSSKSYHSTLQNLIDNGLENDLKALGYVKEADDGSTVRGDRFLRNMRRRDLDFHYKDLSQLSGLEAIKRKADLEAAEKAKLNKEKAETISGKLGELVSGKMGLSSKETRPSDIDLKTGFTTMIGKKALEGVNKIPISSWSYKDENAYGKGRHIGGMAQDMYKQFGDEAAPGGKKINLVSMNGINMAAIQGLSQKQEDLQKKIEDGSLGSKSGANNSTTLAVMAVKAAVDSMHETLKNKSFGIGLGDMDLSGVKAGLGNAANKAKEFAKPLVRTGNYYIDTLQSFAVQGLNDLYDSSSKIARKTKDKAVGIYDDVMRYIDSKEEWIKEKRQKFVAGSLDFAQKTLDRGVKFFTSDIPGFVRDTKSFLERTKEKAKGLLSGPRDVYLRGQTSPCITAVRMRAGLYANAETGQIIYSLDTLLKANADIIDLGRNNEVVLSRSDKADGLFDSEGNELYTLNQAAWGLAKAAGKLAWNTAANGVSRLVDWWKEPTKVGEILRGFFGSVADKFKNFKGFSLTDDRQIALLAQIRDLTAIGKRGRLLRHVYDRDLEDLRDVKGTSFYKLLTGGRVHGRAEDDDANAPESGRSQSSQPEPQPADAAGKKNYGSVFEGTEFGKWFNSLGWGDKIGHMTAGIPGSKNFVGPMPAGAPRNAGANWLERFLKKSPSENETKGPFSGIRERLRKAFMGPGDDFVGPMQQKDPTFLQKFYSNFREKQNAIPEGMTPVEAAKSGIKGWYDKTLERLETDNGPLMRDAVERNPDGSIKKDYYGNPILLKAQPNLLSRTMSKLFMGKGTGLELKDEIVSRSNGQLIIREPNGIYRTVSEEDYAAEQKAKTLSGQMSKRWQDIKGNLLSKKDAFVDSAKNKYGAFKDKATFEAVVALARAQNAYNKLENSAKDKIRDTKDYLREKQGQVKQKFNDARDYLYGDDQNSLLARAKQFNARDAFNNVADKARSMKQRIMLDLDDRYNAAGLSLYDRYRTYGKDRVNSIKDYVSEKRDSFNEKKDALFAKGKEVLSDPKKAGQELVKSISEIVGKLKNVKVPKDIQIGKNVNGPPGSVVDENGQVEVGGFKGFAHKAKGRMKRLAATGLRGLGGVANMAMSGLGAIGGLFKNLGGKAVDAESINDFGTAQENVTNLATGVKGLGDGKSGVNDSDGDGNRDGGSTEMLNRQAELTNQRKQEEARKASEAQKRAQGMKYKSQENAIDKLISSASGLLGSLGSGIMSVLSTAGSVLTSIPGIGKLIGMAGKGAMGLVKGAGSLAMGAGKFLARGGASLGSAAATAFRAGGVTGVGRAALMAGSRVLGTIATTALASSTVTGTVVSAAAMAGKVALAALASPFLLKAAAVAAVGYGAYRLYKYMTRNKADSFQRLRLVQYGVKEEHSDQHRIMALENYFLDGRVAYSERPRILQGKVSMDEIYELFEIPKEDKERKEIFHVWLNERFRPFFLRHIEAIYAANPKVKLEEASKLKYNELQTYLDKAKFDDGPYNVTESPFGVNEISVNTAADIPEMVKLLRESKKPTKEQKSDNAGAIIDNAGLISQEASNRKAREDAAKKAAASAEVAKIAPTEKKPGPVAAMVPESANSSPYNLSEDAGKAPPPGGTPPKDNWKSSGSTLPVAKGPLGPADDGERFLRVKSGVNISNLNPMVRRLLLAMAAEYGKVTGNTIGVTDGFRSFEQQDALYRRSPGKAAKPGSSMHEKGLAFDIDPKAANELEKLGLLRKYGFTRPVGGEAWHVEPAGIQLDINRARNDPNWAKEQIAASPGRGGGGIGSMSGSPMKSRNPAIARSIWENGSSQPVDLSREAANESKPAGGLIPASVSPETEKPKTASSPVSSPNNPFANRITSTRSAANLGSFDSVPKNQQADEGSSPPLANLPAGDQARPKSQGDVRAEIERAAKKAGMDPNVLLLFAAAESSMGTNTKHTGRAQGPFGFMPATWKEQVSKHGSKFGVSDSDSPNDPYASALMTTAYLRQNYGQIKSLAPNPNVVDYYLTHFLGPSGAKRFLSLKPDDVAAKALGDAARSNPNIFFRNPNARSEPFTASEIRKNLESKFQNLAQQFKINGGSVSSTETAEASSGPSGPSSPANTGMVKAVYRPENNQPAETDVSYKTPVQQAALNTVTPQRKVETLRPDDAAASGVMDAMNRSATATEELLKTVRNDMMPVLKGMHETLTAMYNLGAGDKTPEDPAKPTPKAPSQPIPAARSVLDRERKYGT